VIWPRASRRLDAHLRDHFPFTARITIADNGSTDGTWAQASRWRKSPLGLSAGHLERPGRGGALRSIWSASDAAVVAYMDADLSTDLNALLPLLAPLLSGHSDVAIGTRLARGAARRQLRGLIAFGIGLAVTSGALVTLHAVTARPSRAAEVAVLVAANLIATVVRFALYRGWVFRGHGGRAGPAAIPAPSAARPETAPDLVQRQLLDLSD
jgi:glycosyltransferase involved in cell wall biosynthesis